MATHYAIQKIKLNHCYIIRINNGLRIVHAQSHSSMMATGISFCNKISQHLNDAHRGNLRHGNHHGALRDANHDLYPTSGHDGNPDHEPRKYNHSRRAWKISNPKYRNPP